MGCAFSRQDNKRGKRTTNFAKEHEVEEKSKGRSSENFPRRSTIEDAKRLQASASGRL